MKVVACILFSFATVIFSSCNKDGDNQNNTTTAKFSVSGYEVTVPCTITFINISENATSYQWSFGDGNTSTQSNPTHVYNAAGTYILQLTVTGPGGSASACKLLTLEAAPPTNKSAFSYYQEKCSGTPVGISFKTINPLSANTVWDFGNGTVSLVRDPIVQFLLPGDYTIKYSSQLGSIRDTVIRIIQIQ
ncbi:MAG: PKD domain-containing protein [Bacteroidota bacterium]